MAQDLEAFELEEIVVRRSRVPNQEQQENYLELLLEGLPHVMAAHKVGSTGSAFRSLRRNDQRFRRLAERAESNQAETRADVVRASLWEILYEPNHPKHWEAVRFAAEVYLEETGFKRIRQVHQRVDMEQAIAATLHISVEHLREMPDEQLTGLIEQLEQLEAKPQLRAVE